MGGDTDTTVTAHEGRHFWTITNWKSWINCSSENAELYSQAFEVKGPAETTTRWQIKAYPKSIATPGQQFLAFRLVSLNDDTLLGSFHFVTYVDDWMLGRRAVVSFAPLPLDAAWHYSTCVRSHPADDLILCVKIKLVSVTPPQLAMTSRDHFSQEAVNEAPPPNPYLNDEDEASAADVIEPAT